MVNDVRCVSNYLYYLACRENNIILRLSLPKLIFLCQGWSLALRNKVITFDTFIMNNSCPDCYCLLRAISDKPVYYQVNYISGIAETLTEDDKALIEGVYNNYKNNTVEMYSEMQLINGFLIKIKDRYSYGDKIPNKVIKQYFKDYLDKNKDKSHVDNNKNIPINIDKLDQYISSFEQENNCNVLVKNAERVKQLTILKHGENKAIVTLYLLKNGNVTIQYTQGKNVELSELFFNHLIKVSSIN